MFVHDGAHPRTRALMPVTGRTLMLGSRRDLRFIHLCELRVSKFTRGNLTAFRMRILRAGEVNVLSVGSSLQRTTKDG